MRDLMVVTRSAKRRVKQDAVNAEGSQGLRGDMPSDESFSLGPTLDGEKLAPEIPTEVIETQTPIHGCFELAT